MKHIHELKTWPLYFEMVHNGKKSFDLRKDDRNFNEGDILILKEWSKERGYTSREIKKIVGLIVRNVPEFGLMDGYCIIQLKDYKL